MIEASLRNLVKNMPGTPSDVGCATTFSSWLGTGGPNCRPVLQPLPWTSLVDDPMISNALEQITAAGKSAIANLRTANVTASLSIISVYDQTTVYSSGFGQVSLNSSNSPTADTIYDIGSVTKIFTSLLLQQSAASGLCDLDDTLDHFFNASAPPVYNVVNPYGRHEAPSLLSLAGQTSGLPREAPCGVYNPCTEDVIFQYLNAYYSLIAPPFGGAHYSNLGFSLLGRALGRVGKMPYETMMAEMLSDLNMTSSGFNFTPAVVSRMATGYRLTQVGSNLTQTVSPYNTAPLGWTAPAGGMYSSAADLATFFKALFAASDPPPYKTTTVSSYLNSLPNKNKTPTDLSGPWASRGASEKQLTRAKTRLQGSDVPRFLAPGYGNTEGVTGFGAFGWETLYSAGWPVLTKGGLVDGFAASISLVPGLRLGVAVLVNINSGSTADSVNAFATNLLSAALNATVAARQPAPPLPPSEFQPMVVGNFGVKNWPKPPTVYFSVQWSSDKTRLLGSLPGFGTVSLSYDATQSAAYPSQPAVALRYELTGAQSCLMRQELGDNGLLYFTHLNASAPQNTLAMWPDSTLFGLVKLS
jgi:CubicO group peptidase (beta-lactamase class C family)